MPERLASACPKRGRGRDQARSERARACLEHARGHAYVHVF
jgi:hypothetical protein